MMFSKIKTSMWIKIESTLGTKPEVFMLANLLAIKRAEVVGHLVCLWTWVDQNTENGVIQGTTEMLDELTIGGFSDALQKVGWLVVNDMEMHLPNFDKHNGQTAKQRAQVNRRVAKHRAKEKPSNPPSVTSALPDKIRKDKKINYQMVIDAWNMHCTPKVTKLTPKRKTAIKVLLANFAENEIAPTFAKIPNVPFLVGRNDTGWRADFDYAIKLDKFTKLAEGGWDTPNTSATNYNTWNNE